MLLSEWMSRSCPVIGMLHAPALPGSPDYRGDFASVRHIVLRDAEALVAGGVDGLMLENFGDVPFYPDRVPAITVAAMTSLGSDLKWRFGIPLGINVLRNDGRSALAVAIACGAEFIRVNVLCGARVADQGILHGIAHDLLRERANLKAQSIQIWADVDVKHSAALAARPLKDEVSDLIDRGKADALIVSGSATGQPIDPDTLRAIKSASASTPVLMGSGVNAETVSELVPYADGAIVGSSLKQDGKVRNPVETSRVIEFMEAINRGNVNNSSTSA
ncbi:MULTISPECIES: BtpA/SgcQ family protein [unclassified Schlesneria]|uniref:BtpA/SgcQ family protein n=1 Tax=Schlesneria TaxID=656899 RepID=UPI0035A0B4FA